MAVPACGKAGCSDCQGAELPARQFLLGFAASVPIRGLHRLQILRTIIRTAGGFVNGGVRKHEKSYKLFADGTPLAFASKKSVRGTCPDVRNVVYYRYFK